jgi:signal transduction histidine kinase
MVENIFYPYFNIKREFSRFGLATAYQNIKKHDGLITVDSKSGQGTCFDIYLRLVRMRMWQVLN